MPIICSLHPRTKDKIKKFKLKIQSEKIQMLEPFGFFDFIHLVQNAFCVLSDSGTVQEECCIFHVPNVTLRDVTERPETIECGSNILSSVDPDDVIRCLDSVITEPPTWTIPPEYCARNVSSTVTKIICSYYHKC